MEVPWPRVTLPPPERVNVGTWTPRMNVVVALKAPDLPLTVMVYCPTGAELLAVSVSWLLPDAGFGFQSAVTPLGSPDTDSVTLPVNPNCELI